MGRFINPGYEAFEMSRNFDCFVDKSMLLRELNKYVNGLKRMICVSRPRRFGKTIMAQALSAYYTRNCDSRAIFERLEFGKTENFDQYLNKFNVVKIDCNNFSSYVGKTGENSYVNKINSEVVSEFKHEFPEIDFSNCPRIADCIGRVHLETGVRFVVIMDEYDLEVRMAQAEPLHQEYLDFLVSLFKNDNLSPAIALAYITGILPIVKDKFQSKLNNFVQKTMLDSIGFERSFGFTEDEVKSLCDRFDIDYQECKRWYQGYEIEGVSIFNPEAIVQVKMSRKFKNHWSATGSYESVRTYIDMNLDGTKESIVKMLSGERIPVDVDFYDNTLDNFEAKDDVFTYLIHLGYLAYDEQTQMCHIPNREVRDEWVKAIKRNGDYANVMRFVNESENLLLATINGDENAVSASIKASHELVCNNLNFNNEGSYQSAIIMAYFYANCKFSIFKELTTGKGYADVVFVPYVPNLPAIIVELKRNQSADTALTQIRNKEYFESLSHYHGNLLFVGINYDETTKEHECKIERFEK